MKSKFVLLRPWLILVMAWWVFLHAQATVVGQGLDTPVTYFEVKKGLLASALQSLQQDLHINLLYDVNDLKTTQINAIKFKNTQVTIILQTLLKDTGLTFEEKQGVIVVKPIPKPTKGQSKVTKEIKGKVTDASNNTPLPGVNVVIKGTTIGTTTDSNGQYTITVPDEASILVFSFVGYTTEEITIANRNTIDISLNQDVATLQDIVVIGYGTAKKGEVTSAITSISPDQFNKGVVTSPDQLLQGKVAGLNITRSGDPNATPSVILRGASTLRTGSAQEPLYVIDGVVGASISLVPPDDIVSIDVLKDASATAIYGNRAANGVIIITTRKQKPSYGFSYNGYVALENVSHTIDMLTGDQLRKYLSEHGQSLDPVDEDSVNTDWQKEVMRQGISHSHTISYGGGTEKSTFNASVNYLQRQGIMKNSESERLIGKISLDQKTLNDKLKLSFSLTNSIYNQKLIPNAVFRQMLTYLPTVNIYNEDGSFKENTTRTQYYNPLALINQYKENKKTNTLLASGGAELQIIKGLTYNLNLSLQTENIADGAYLDSHSPYPITINGSSVTGQGAGGIAQRYTYTNTRKLLENYLTYNPFSNAQHDLKILAGYSIQQNDDKDGFGATSQGFTSDVLGYNNISLGKTSSLNNDGYGTATLRLISFYSRINYNLFKRYFVQMSLRRDGSSAFAGNNQWGNFPSVSAGWNIAQEDFMKAFPVFDDLKLRASYGITGNSLGFGYYVTKESYSNNGYFYYNGSYIRALGLASNVNPDLKWEKTGMLNIGLDFSLLNGKISGSVEYYDKRTSDLIWDYTVSSVTNTYTTLTANAGKMQNKGVEVTLNATPIAIGQFRWNLTATVSHNKNQLLSLSNSKYTLEQVYTAQPGGLGQSDTYTQILKAGHPVGQYFTAKYVGQKDGVSVFQSADGGTTTTPQQKDYVYAGNAQPKLLYGLNSSFTWKNLDLNFFLRGVYGNKIFNATLANLNVPSQGTIRNLPVFSLNESFTDTQANIYSTRYIESGSYLRLDNITLGYTISPKSKYMKSTRVYLTSQNLFTITKYRGIDPEITGGGLTPGLDNDNYYPKTRTFVLGVNVQF